MPPRDPPPPAGLRIGSSPLRRGDRGDPDNDSEGSHLRAERAEAAVRRFGGVRELSDHGYS
jgi:hypothetical protein